MKKLRELYSKGTQGEWCSLHHYNDVFVAENTTVCTTQNGDDADLIAAMHNALPELLDAWETLEALRWANKKSEIYIEYVYKEGDTNPCMECPVKYKCGRGASEMCRYALYHESSWLAAYRERGNK